MIEYLVTEMGFNIFALECPFGEALDVNRYVLEGIGDPEKAIAGIYYCTWDTKEVLALLEWMRAYNSDPQNEQKVKFYGFDPQDPQRAARITLEYASKVDPKLATTVLPELNTLQVPFSIPQFMGRRQYIPEEYDTGSWVEIKRVMKAFDDNKDQYISQTDEMDGPWQDNYAIVRESGQTENIKWILDHEGESSKAIVWAHNSTWSECCSKR
jgi:erythromycin esterase